MFSGSNDTSADAAASTANGLVFRSLRDRGNGRCSARLRGKFTASEEQDAEEEEDAKTDDASEKSAVKLCRKARKKFIERGLVGSVSITRTLGITTVDVSLDITEDDLANSSGSADDDTASEAGEENELTNMETKAVSAMDHMLNVLTKRAYGSWRNVEFKDNATLSRSVTIGVVGPLFKVGLEFGITLSATVPSLIAHAVREGIRP